MCQQGRFDLSMFLPQPEDEQEALDALCGINKRLSDELAALREQYRWRDVDKEFPNEADRDIEWICKSSNRIIGRIGKDDNLDDWKAWCKLHDPITHWRYCDDGPEEQE